MTTYRPAPAARRIGDDLVARHHPDLEGVRIEYVFRDKAAKSKGREVWGAARKITGLAAYLAAGLDEHAVDDFVDDLFVIELAEDVWRRLTDAQRRALVDHELCHCTTTVDDNGAVSLTTVAHDLEEFVAVVERHGLWREDVEVFAASTAQARLPLDDDHGDGGGPEVTVIDGDRLDALIESGWVERVADDLDGGGDGEAAA